MVRRLGNGSDSIAKCDRPNGQCSGAPAPCVVHCASRWGTALGSEAGYGLDGPPRWRESLLYSGSSLKIRVGKACCLDIDDALQTWDGAANLVREFTTIGARDEQHSGEP